MVTKRFHLGDLVSVTTGRLVSSNHMDGVYAVVDHVTGVQHLAPQLPRACDVVTLWLIEQHPWLADIAVPDWVSDEASVYSWLEQAVAEYGEFHDVEQMPFGAYVGLRV